MLISIQCCFTEFKKNIPSCRSRTSDLRMAVLDTLQSSALPTELSKAVIICFVFKIFKLSCFRYFVLRKDGTRHIWFFNAKECALERRGIIFYDSNMLFIHSWRQRHFKLYVIGVFNFYTVNGFDFKLFKNNFSNIIKVANVSRFDVTNF